MGTQNVLGTNYSYPDSGDDPWGDPHIAWASAVSSATNILQNSINTINGVTIPNLQSQINLSGQANTTSNQGGGHGLAMTKVGVDLPFKTLVAGTNITLTPTSNTITIASTGVGNVNGPAGSVDGNVALFDSTTGKLLKMGGLNQDGSNNVTGVNNLTTTGTITTNGNLVGARGYFTFSTNVFGNPGSDTYLTTEGGTSGQQGFLAHRAGSIIGMSVSMTTTTFSSTESWTPIIRVNGSNTLTGPQIVVSSNGTFKSFATANRNLYNFSANDQIQFFYDVQTVGSYNARFYLQIEVVYNS